MHNVQNIRINDIVKCGPTGTTKYRIINISSDKTGEELELTLFIPEDEETLDVVFGEA